MTAASRRVLVVLLPTLAVALAGAATHDPGEAVDSGWAESVVVERVFWPVRFESARNFDPRPDDCVGVTVDDVKVLEDGRRVPVTHLDRASLPTTHAILIDTSYSMRPRLAQAKSAALSYVRDTAPDEPILVASFDDSLILRARRTRDVGELERAIGELDLGNGTDLWGSVYHLVRYLEPLPGRKVIVLLSDGMDTHSVRSDAFETARWFAGTTPNLTIYPIGLQIPDDRGYVAPISRGSLDLLARVTGGRFLLTATPGELERTFRTIRELLDRELFVTYIPPPFGEGPRDRPERQSFRLRKVSVRVRGGTLCRLAPGIPKERFVGRRSSTPDALLEVRAESDGPASIDDPPGGARAGHPCLPAGESAAVVRRYVLPERWMPTLPGEQAGSLALLGDPRLLVGEVVDVVRESGQLYDAAWLAWTGGYRVGGIGPPRGRARSVAVDTAPLRETRRSINDPLAVMLRLLRQESCRGPGGRSPLVINGRTFLHLRRYIGQALFQGRPGLRAFAVERFRAESRSEGQTLLRDLEAAGYSEEQRAAVLRALHGRAERPEAGQPQRLLADWLADVPLASVARRLESGAIDRLLAGRPGGPGGADEIEALWPAMRRHFPAPTEERIRVPLILAFDPELDRFGFYRFVLPRFRPHAPPLGEVPPRPLAIATMRRALADAPGLATGTPPLRVDGDVAYESLEGAGLARLAPRLGVEPPAAADDASRSLHGIAVTIPLLARGGGVRATIREVWGRRAGEAVETPQPLAPLCRSVVVDGPPGEPGALGPLAELGRVGDGRDCP